jgi:zinc transporter, ZIP family
MEAAAWGLVIAASLLAGAVAAVRLRLPERVAALATAFGGGILFAAIALELVPEADTGAGPALTAGGLVAGTLVYVAADARLSQDPSMRAMRRMGHAAAAGRPMSDMAEPAVAGRPPSGAASADNSVAQFADSDAADRIESARGESIAAGIFVDGVPESIALGLTIAQGELGLALLAGVLLGNVVEAYGAAQPILAGGRSRGFVLRLLGGIGIALALATTLGGTVLAGASNELVGTLQAIAAGAVLAVISVAIVPHAFKEVSRTVATATVAGFVAGYLLS